MRKMLYLCLPLLLIFNAGCRSAPLPEGEPALISQDDTDSRRELSQVIASALGIKSVTLADDAFTETSALAFDPASSQAGKNATQDSVVSTSPELFRLLLDGPQCVLVHERTELRWLLMDTECIAE
ncbi:MAG: hypothetical protein RIA65_08675 [Woeseia sp.]